MPNRVYFASKRAGIAPDGSLSYLTLRGLQSLGMTTTFNLEQVFEIGQLAIYENIEGIPDVSLEMEKVLDGNCPLYLLATQQAAGASLSGRSAAKCQVAVSIYNDAAGDTNSATGVANAEAVMSGMFVSAVSYSATVDGNATESLTMVGNDKVWIGMTAGSLMLPTRQVTYIDEPFVNDDDEPRSISGSGGVNRREDVLFVYPGGWDCGVDANGSVSGDGTVLPSELPGITSSGTNEKAADGSYGCHVQNISMSVDLGREEIFELGRRGLYHRYVTFPVEVTTEIGVHSVSGDLISATEEGVNVSTGTCITGTNLSNQTIRLHMCEGLQVDVGKKNKLASVGVTGGDTGGGNEEITYTYTNFNVMSVYHQEDPNRSGVEIPIGGGDQGIEVPELAYSVNFDPLTPTAAEKDAAAYVAIPLRKAENTKF
jgi:hypothetical protein